MFPSESRVTVESVTATLAPAAASLAGELRRAAADARDRPFLRLPEGEWTYGRFDAEVDRVAAGLRAQGVQRGHVVSLMLPNGIDFLRLWFALARLGAVTAPLNTAFRGAALADALELAGSTLLVMDASLREAVAAALTARTRPLQVLTPGAPGDPGPGWLATPAPGCVADVDLAGADLCLLLYTSGTTGRSKAAMIAHRFVLRQAELFIAGLGLRADDVLYCPYPLYHLDATVLTVAPALRLRAVAAIGARFSVSRYWDEVRLFRATVFDFMGATLTLLWKQPPGPADRDHHARLGWGVPLPDWAPQFEARFGCRLVELYGSTEVGVPILTAPGGPRRPGSCGRLHGPFDLCLVDEAGFEVPDGQPGELLVRAREPALLMQGYYAMPEVTLAAFRDLWFHTGDVLRRDAGGFYTFVGRRKDIVRRRGENISAAEVEIAIEQHPDVLVCAVIGVPSEMTEEDVMACVVCRPGRALAAPALAAWCEGRMARFMVPRYWRLLAALPMTPTDKVEKFRLQAEGRTPDTWDREASPA